MLPSLIVFDLDACMWSPEMYELSSAPDAYCSKRGGVVAGRDTVKLFPGASAVLQRLADGADGKRFERVKLAVASSTTEPGFAQKCLEEFPLNGRKLGDLLHFRQIYPGSKGGQHFPKLKEESGIPYEEMIFFDDCTYSDNCADVAHRCPGVTCVRTPHGLTEEDFDLALAAFAAGKRGLLK
ncbi:unnamed protein product [Effrenium voratum]|uniref:Magnesium-dependent phosphatase 1 n=1 Tax=Effrenium voratum TaxID=2562239 RepID=A0AA36J4R6_9DINO|nr:unnamed protein product [Effrenium voratum]CAJ1399191.1 unnamed protein product [Effrenium voratum]CAJ1422457.1 unnamed protein product [Effrenium voratum]